MIKVNFQHTKTMPISDLALYDSFSRIPLSLKVGKWPSEVESIYCRNLHDENFTELWFNKNDKTLREIVLVSFQSDTIKLVETIEYKTVDTNFYSCCIESDKEIHISVPTCILRSKKEISVNWSFDNLFYYRVAMNCIIGVDANSNLSSITIELDEEKIYDVFGF